MSLYIKRFRNSISSSGRNEAPKNGAEVKLNVYDMVSAANFNQYSSPIGFGVFHSGVEIYGCEYAYGGHNDPHSGVFEIAPRDVASLGADSFKFRESIVIGRTEFEPHDVKQIVEQFGVKFRGDKYHLLHQNCNHFTDELTKVSSRLQTYENNSSFGFVLTVNSIDRKTGPLWAGHTNMGQSVGASQLDPTVSGTLDIEMDAFGTE